jgi:hypothetical protein
MADTNSSRPDLDASRNPEIDFEGRDLPVRVIALAGLVLAFFLALSPVLLLYGFPGIGADVSRKLRVLPPEPRLQTNPCRDLQAELSRQRGFLNSYGWVDSAHQIARVPITVAMKHVAANGLEGFPHATSQAPRP